MAALTDQRQPPAWIRLDRRVLDDERSSGFDLKGRGLLIGILDHASGNIRPRALRNPKVVLQTDSTALVRIAADTIDDRGVAPDAVVALVVIGNGTAQGRRGRLEIVAAVGGAGCHRI